MQSIHSNICIIVPCYNEEKRMPVRQFEEFMAGKPYTFCFVNDGSTDNTMKILNGLNEKFSDKTFIVDTAVNKGKAEAVRTGINFILEKSRFEYVGYIDADLAIPLEEIDYLLHFMQFNDAYQYAMGSRIRRLGSDIKRNTVVRHILGRFFATLISNTLQLAVYDTQCGIKIIKSALAQQIFKEEFITRWLFDIELLARILKIRNGDTEIFIEVPLRSCVETGNSKIKIREVLLFPWELLKIRRHYSKAVRS